MKPLRYRPIALALTCLFAKIQAAQATDIAENSVAPESAAYAASAPSSPVLARDGDDAAGGGERETDASPEETTISAEKISGQADEITRAEGDVRLYTEGTQMFADKMDYYLLEDEIRANGNVRVLQKGVEVSGPYLQMKISEKIGYFDNARYKISRSIERARDRQDYLPGQTEALPALPARLSTGYGQATRIHFEGENQFRIENGTYSTCKPDADVKQDWFAKSGDIKLDYDENNGTARDATLYFKDMPIFYAPYFSFSLNNQRKSGVLAPTFSSSTRTGLDLSVPYYWNIAPNYDATIVPRVMSKRGLQIGAEIRYKDHYADSEARFEILPRDKQEAERRYAFDFRHAQNLGGGFSTYIEWGGASDDDYFTDLSSRVVQTSQRQITRQFQLNYNREWLSVNLRTLRYQTLNPDNDDEKKDYWLDHPYFLQPQVTVKVSPVAFGALEAQAEGQYTRFTHPMLTEGERTVFYPQIALPFLRSGYYVIPKIGLHMTRYQVDQRAANLPQSLHRTLPIFSLDVGMTFERETQLLGNRWTQTLEPRLYYLNIPHKDQSRYPLFDSGLADFNFAQIFSENRFSGYDRINNARQLTAALTSRLIDPASGGERLRAMVGQRYYFEPLKVGLPGETLYHDKYSDFLAALSGQVAPKVHAHAALEYNIKHSSTERVTLSARYQPDYGKTLSIAYRYNRGINWSTRQQNVESMDQIDIAGQWRLSSRWYAVGRYNYAFDASRLVEGIVGVEYSAGCWVARLVAQRLETTAGSPNTSLFFQLELNDFGRIGSNPLQMLRRSVPGYTNISELPELSSGALLSDE
ncbi:MAG: LPS-assembly protein LptD [Zoogloeaceae bacterium]|jgi:LPS-assembly protein|nr:LPS-assembly protein LptD [Zoogloeaceae bacterium]